MRVRITRRELRKLHSKGKVSGMRSVRQLDRRTHLVVISGTSQEVVVGV